MNRTLKIVGLAGSLLGVIYCGAIVFHLVREAESWGGAAALGVGPTIGGLGIVGGLIAISVIWKLFRLFPVRPPSGGVTPRQGSWNEPDASDTPPLDADAMISRYLAKTQGPQSGGAREADTPAAGPAPRPAMGVRPAGQAPAGFGRRGR